MYIHFANKYECPIPPKKKKKKETREDWALWISVFLPKFRAFQLSDR